MADENYDLNLRRLKFIEACAYYIIFRKIPVEELRLTSDLATLISKKLNQANIFKEIGLFKFTKYLSGCMAERLPNIGEEVKIEKSIVQFYNFRSMVAKLANELKALISPEPMDVIDNGSPLSLYSLPPSSSSVSSVSPYYDEIDTLRCDFLKGFSLQLKADPHLDESIPISARDQHLLYNIFGDKWNSPIIVEAYIIVKGKTGYMSSWSPKDAKKSNVYHINEYGSKH